MYRKRISVNVRKFMTAATRKILQLIFATIIRHFHAEIPRAFIPIADGPRNRTHICVRVPANICVNTRTYLVNFLEFLQFQYTELMRQITDDTRSNE